MHIPSERPAIVEDNRPPSSWPSMGRIELQALKVRKQVRPKFLNALHMSTSIILTCNDEIDTNYSFFWSGSR